MMMYMLESGVGVGEAVVMGLDILAGCLLVYGVQLQAALVVIVGCERTLRTPSQPRLGLAEIDVIVLVLIKINVRVCRGLYELTCIKADARFYGTWGKPSGIPPHSSASALRSHFAIGSKSHN
jgi:hypothetical protein